MLIACGGWDGEQALSTVEMLDPSKGEWTPLPSMLAPRRVVGDTLYAVGGWNMVGPYSPTIRTKGLARQYVYSAGGYDLSR